MNIVYSNIVLLYMEFIKKRCIQLEEGAYNGVKWGGTSGTTCKGCTAWLDNSSSADGQVLCGLKKFFGIWKLVPKMNYI